MATEEIKKASLRKLKALLPKNAYTDIGCVEEIFDGVFSYVANDGEHFFPGQFYAVSPSGQKFFPQTCLAYGTPCGDALVFGDDSSEEGYAVVAYEIAKYCVDNNINKPEFSLSLAAAYMRIENPEYIGPLTPPILTPWGKAAQTWEVVPGMYFVVLESGMRLFTMCDFLWEINAFYIQNFAMLYSHGDIAYRSMELQDAPIVVYEMLLMSGDEKLKKALRHHVVSNEALETYLFDHFPKYCEAHHIAYASDIVLPDKEEEEGSVFQDNVPTRLMEIELRTPEEKKPRIGCYLFRHYEEHIGIFPLQF